MDADELVFEVGSVVDCRPVSPGGERLHLRVRLATGREFTLLLSERALFELRSGLAALQAIPRPPGEGRRVPTYQ